MPLPDDGPNTGGSSERLEPAWLWSALKVLLVLFVLAYTAATGVMMYLSCIGVMPDHETLWETIALYVYVLFVPYVLAGSYLIATLTRTWRGEPACKPSQDAQPG